jgi:hypothetical protein
MPTKKSIHLTIKVFYSWDALQRLRGAHRYGDLARSEKPREPTLRKKREPEKEDDLLIPALHGSLIDSRA